MRKYVLVTALLMFISPVAYTAPRVVKEVPLNNSLKSVPQAENQICFGWELFSWSDWLKRPSSGPLMIPGSYEKMRLEVFEAHSSGIVAKPVSTFTKEYLHNIATIKRLDPNNKHTQRPGEAFSTETVVDFPASWAQIIIAAKNTKMLADDSAPFLSMDSVFGYASKSEIAGSEQLMNIVKLLDNSNNAVPDVINIQGIVHVNQIAQFGAVVTLFYGLDAKRTLVVNYFALALKKRILDMGINGSGGMNFTGRSVLLGQNQLLNSSTGIGAGLPTYTREFFEQMLNGL